MERIKVLLVEDDPSLRMVISETLELEDFNVVAVSDGIEGLHYFNEGSVDVIVADIMIPRLDGIEMVKRIRQRNQNIPILFLTAKSSVDSVVEGFEAGGNDYLRKPFSMKELIVRIKALSTRGNAGSKVNYSNQWNNITIGKYSFDPISQYLIIEDKRYELSSKESELLRLLATNLNNVVSAKHIMMELWGDDSYYIGKSLQVFITRLRQRLQRDSTVRIVNARGEGYKLIIDLPNKG